MASIRSHAGLIAYLFLAGAVTLALFGYARHNDQRAREQLREQCDLVSFTRATQREVVGFLQETSVVLSTHSRTPAVRAYFRSRLEELAVLRNRTEPPPCATKDR